LGDLDKKFESGETVTLDKMIKTGLIKAKNPGVKILAEGKLTKKLTVMAHGFSKKAENAIKKAGGEVKLIK